MFIKISGKQHYLWRAVDQDGEVGDISVQIWRNGAAAMQLFKRLRRNHDCKPHTIVTDKLASYKIARRKLMTIVHHDTTKCANNRAEQSH